MLQSGLGWLGGARRIEIEQIRAGPPAEEIPYRTRPHPPLSTSRACTARSSTSRQHFLQVTIHNNLPFSISPTLVNHPPRQSHNPTPHSPPVEPSTATHISHDSPRLLASDTAPQFAVNRRLSAAGASTSCQICCCRREG